MEIGIGTYEAAGSAPVLTRDQERRDETARQEQTVSHDKVSISEAARSLLQIQEGGETPNDPSGGRGRTPFYGKNGVF